ncbi:MAG: pyridoxine 5'-phosphate synthase [Chitinophagales bacterium]
MTTKLSININKIAWLRNARGIGIPNVLQFAKDCARYGADGVTVHPRPDERHITKQDTYDLGDVFPTTACEYNIEGYPSDDFIKMVCEIKPTQVTLVPDEPGQLTSDHGWDTVKHETKLTEVLAEFARHNIRTSLFIDPLEKNLAYTKKVGADRIEFYTGPYSFEFAKGKEKAIAPFTAVLPLIKELGLGINAGHDLNLDNLRFFKEQIPELLEVSIGHAFVKDCLYFGLENTVQLYKRLLQD